MMLSATISFFPPRVCRAVRATDLLLFLLVLSSGLIGCRGETDWGDPSLRLEVSLSPTPPAVGPARVIITLNDTLGTPVEGALVVVEGNMIHAGMVPVVETAQAEDPGRYGISAFTFTMAGDWVLDLRATLPDGRWVRTRHPTNVVGPMGEAR
jgi:hypothetical protein